MAKTLDVKVSDLKSEVVQKIREFMGDAWKEEMIDVVMFTMSPPTPESRAKRRIAEAIIAAIARRMKALSHPELRSTKP